MKMKLFAKISKQFQTDDEIKTLVIESDEKDSGGFFLFLHQSLDQPCEADLWFTDLEGAKIQALDSYGVPTDAWQVLE